MSTSLDHVLEKFNDFESTEIEIPDDIFEEDLVGVKENLQRIPQITFVANAELQINTNHSSAVMACPICSKLYKRKSFYQKHVESCGMNNTEDIVDKSKTSGKGYLSITLDELQASCMELVSSSLQTIINDKINSLVVGTTPTPGNILRDSSEKILKIEYDLFRCFCHDIITSIGQIILKTNFLNASSKESMWTDLMVWINCFKFKTIGSWDNVMQSAEIQEVDEMRLVHSLSMDLLKNILNKNNLKQNLSTCDEVRISEEEQKILRYVAGYIVYSLKSKYRKLLSNRPTDKTIMTCNKILTSIETTDEEIKARTFLDYTNEWVTLVDRGGLVKVNDDMLIFIRRIENIARKILNTNFLRKYRGQDVRDAILIELKANSLVNHGWEVLIRNFENDDVTDTLKNQVMKKWIDIRAKAFVDVNIQILRRKLNTLKLQKDREKEAKKQEKKISKSGEPAMRKTLE